MQKESKKFELPEERVSLRQALNAAVDFLCSKKIEEAENDSRLLLEKATGLSKTEYFLKADDEIEKEKKQNFIDLIEKRGERIPLQYICGEAWFYGRSFLVNQAVLIPRMDTEILVEEALKKLSEGASVLDMCTGSGCIILTLAKEAGVEGYGVDVSSKALELAAENKKRLNAKCDFLESNLFEKVQGQFDMIISNPPYIRSKVIEELETEVKDHEPRLALDGGPDGLEFYRKITAESRKYLKKGGYLFFEIGYDQGQEVLDLMKENGFQNGKITKDLNGLPRVVSAVKS